MDQQAIWESLYSFCLEHLKTYANEIKDKENAQELIEARALALISLLDELIKITNVDNIATIRDNYVSENKEDKTGALNRFTTALYSDLLKASFDLDQIKLNEILQQVNLQRFKGREGALASRYMRVLQEMSR